MSFNKFKKNSYCVGGKHNSTTTNLHGDIRNKNIKMLRGTCMMCSRNKSLIVSDQTIKGERLGDFFKHLGSAAKNVGKKILNNPARASEIAANIGTAAASNNRKLIAATAHDVIKFVHQRKGLYKAEGLSGKAAKAGEAGKSLYLGKIHLLYSLNKYNKCIQFIIGMTWKNFQNARNEIFTTQRKIRRETREELQASEKQLQALRDSSQAIQESSNTPQKSIKEGIQDYDEIANCNNQLLTSLVNYNQVDSCIIKTFSNLLNTQSQFSLEPIKGNPNLFTINPSNPQQVLIRGSTMTFENGHSYDLNDPDLHYFNIL